MTTEEQFEVILKTSFIASGKNTDFYCTLKLLLSKLSEEALQQKWVIDLQAELAAVDATIEYMNSIVHFDPCEAGEALKQVLAKIDKETN